MRTQLAKALIGSGDDRGHPLAGRVQRGAPRPCRLLDGQRFAQPRRVLFAGAVSPACLPGVGEEYHRPHHTIGQRLGIAVGVIGLRSQHPVGAARIGDEWDGTVVTTKRCAGQGESASGVAERFPDRLTPRLGVAAMVDFVKDDQGLALFGAHPVQRRVRGDLGVGDHHAVVFRRGLGVGVGEFRVQGQAVFSGGLRPLDLEVFGGHDDGDLIDGAMGD